VSGKRFRVLIADDVSPECMALFEGDDRFEVIQDKLRGEALLKAIGGFDGLIVRSGCKVTAEVLAQATRLRAVVRAGVGVDNIDTAEATRRGILVMNTPAGNTISTAEHAMTLLLATARSIPRADRSVRAGTWKKPGFLGVELRGKVLGVIGLGKVGREVARRAKGFEMEILGFDPMVNDDFARQLGVKLAELDEIFAKADFITVHVPLTPKTKGLIDAEVMNRLKPGVRLINCARGGVIDQAALIEALKDGRVAAAALDVYESEPLAADHPLTGLDNIVLTPHLGASTQEAQENVGIMSGRQIKAYLLQGEIENSINTVSLDAQEVARIEPYVKLMHSIGGLQAQLLDGKLQRIRVLFAGAEFADGGARRRKALVLSALEGFFRHYLNAPVNRVSVMHFAKEHGIDIDEAKSTDSGGFENLVTLEVETDAGRRIVSGALFGANRPRIVMIDGYTMDAVPEGIALLFRNDDRPGMLGIVGQVLGQAGVNIANVSMGRDMSGGTALAFMNIDSEPNAVLRAALEALEGVPWLRIATL